MVGSFEKRTWDFVKMEKVEGGGCAIGLKNRTSNERRGLTCSGMKASSSEDWRSSIWLLLRVEVVPEREKETRSCVSC